MAMARTSADAEHGQCHLVLSKAGTQALAQHFVPRCHRHEALELFWKVSCLVELFISFP